MQTRGGEDPHLEIILIKVQTVDTETVDTEDAGGTRAERLQPFRYKSQAWMLSAELACFSAKRFFPDSKVLSHPSDNLCYRRLIATKHFSIPSILEAPQDSE